MKREDLRSGHWTVRREDRGFPRQQPQLPQLDEKAVPDLPAIFSHGNCCRLDAFHYFEKKTPQRTVGNTYAFATFSPMQERTLYLRLEHKIYGFEQKAKQVRCVYGFEQKEEQVTPRPPNLEPIDPWIMVSIHIVKAKSEKTVLLVDERRDRDRPIAVINDAIHWSLEGFKLKAVT